MKCHQARGLKGHQHPAQGIALGRKVIAKMRPARAKAFARFGAKGGEIPQYPGRCPGLPACWPYRPQ